MSATINLENVTVDRIFGKAEQGVQVYDEITIERGQRKGEQIKIYYTAWSDGGEPWSYPSGEPLEEGDVVTISGSASAQLDEWDDKKEVDENGDPLKRRRASIVVNDAFIVDSDSEVDEEDEDGGF